MFNSVVLDVVIGLIFIYLLYSLLASIIQEIISTRLGFRAKMLEMAIIQMLNDEKKIGDNWWSKFLSSSRVLSRLQIWRKLFGPGKKQCDPVAALSKDNFAAHFYHHALVKYLAEDKWHSKPSYLTSKNFSKVVVDLIAYHANPDTPIKHGEDIRVRLNKFLDENSDKTETFNFIRGLLIESQNDLEKFKANLEKWFDDTMEHATAWYKRNIQIVLFSIGMVVAFLFNVDTIEIAKRLTKDEKARNAMVQMAGDYVKNNPELDKKLAKIGSDTDTLKAVKDYFKRIDSLNNIADSLIKTDIADANKVLGIGYKTILDSCGCPNVTDVNLIATVVTNSKLSEYRDRTNIKNSELSEKLVECNNMSGLSKTWMFTKDFTQKKLAGLTLTALAISLGAPFWFDLLNKLMKLRGTGNKPGAKNTDKETEKVG